jgi:hypothetical protein
VTLRENDSCKRPHGEAKPAFATEIPPVYLDSYVKCVDRWHLIVSCLTYDILICAILLPEFCHTIIQMKCIELFTCLQTSLLNTCIW